MDLAVVDSGISSAVLILLGKGDGTFQQLVSYSVKSYPAMIVAADFNGDGRPDLAVTSTHDVSILLGKEAVGQQYGGVNVLPTTFFIDRDGKIVAREFGLQSRSVFVDHIKQALSQGRTVQAQK